MAKSSEEIIAEEKKKIEQARARIQTILNRENTKERKIRTRQQVILGGLILDAAKKDARWHRALSSLMSRISRDQDKRAFENFVMPPVPEGETHE